MMFKKLLAIILIISIATVSHATVLRQVKLMDADGNLVDVQFPLAVDGDSVYSKDIDSASSSIGTFTGDVLSLFNDYGTEITDTSGTNPKTFTIAFERPIKSNTIAFGSQTGNFSNVKIQLKDLAGTVRVTIDDSTNNTDYTSNVYAFTTNVFIEAVIEFHTTDPVKISGMYVPKVQSRAISAIDGYVSETNSSSTPLTGGASFTGTQVDTLNYGMVLLSVYSDVASATDGLSVQFRSTSTGTWRESDAFTINAASEKTFSIQAVRRFMRIVYTNGAAAQTVFDLQTVMKPVYVKPSSHRISDEISGEDDAELTKSLITAESDDGSFPNITASLSHNLKITDAEDALDIARGNVVGQSTVHKFGRGADIDTADGFVVLWDGAEYNAALKTYTYSTTADIDRISSDNNSDTVAIEITGLDTNWDLVTQTKTLTGQTPVALDTSLIRVFRMKNVGATDLLGNVFCFVNVTTTLGVPDTITNTRAMINNGNNQTLMAIYTIPNDKTGYILSWYAALSSAKASSFNNMEMKARPFGGVFQLKHTSTLSSAGSSHVQHTFFVPQSFPEKTDFVMLSDSSVNDNAVSAGFDLILVDD
jgi:hypothetical protein